MSKKKIWAFLYFGFLGSKSCEIILADSMEGEIKYTTSKSLNGCLLIESLSTKVTFLSMISYMVKTEEMTLVASSSITNTIQPELLAIIKKEQMIRNY